MRVIEAWPFLVSRNRKFGYRTVVAPQFLYDQNLSGILAETAGGDVTERGHANYREIQGPGFGQITLIFRVVRARENHIGLDSNVELVDQHGRPIDLIEGIVLKGKAWEPAVTNNDLQHAHEQIEEAYREFWNNTISLPTVQPSTSIHLQMDGDENERVVLKKLAPFQITPTTKEAWLDEGNAHYKAKQYEEALAGYEQAIRLDPNYAGAYISKGKTLTTLERYKEALAAYEQAIRLDPNSAIAINGKGNALYYLKRYEEALAAYEQAIRLDPNYAGVYANKGNALSYLKRYEEALAAYEQAIRLDPTFYSTYIHQGYTFYDLGRYEEALTAYEQAIHLDPNKAQAYRLTGNVLEKLGRRGEAQQFLNSYKKLKTR